MCTSCSSIVLKIIRMIRDDAVSLRDISEELRKDQVLSAKVIGFANSAFWNIEQKIDAIDRALVFLGEKTVSTVDHFFFARRLFPRGR